MSVNGGPAERYVARNTDTPYILCRSIATGERPATGISGPRERTINMGDPTLAAACLAEACKAAKRRDTNTLDRKLRELNRMDLEIPDPNTAGWVQDIIRDEGVRIGKDIFIKKGPGRFGVKFEVKF